MMDSSQAVDLRVRPLSPFVGAEVDGVDVRRLAPPELARIKELFLEHHLLVFPEQDLTDADIQRFAEHFGPLERNQVRGVDGAVLPPVHRIANVDLQGRPSANPLLKSNYTWHTDKAYLPTPSLLTLLWGEEIPPAGGDTQFVSTEQAYDTLPAATKQRIEGLRVVQDFKHMLDTLGQHDIIRADEIPPPAVHPLVRTHPETGRKSLFVANYSSGIVGMEETEGRRLIRELLDHATQEKFIFVQRWKPHDLVIWDNRSLLHRAIPNYDMGKDRRILRRCVVRGGVPRMSAVSNYVSARGGAGERLGMAEFVRELVSAADRHGADVEGLRVAIRDPIRRLLKREDLLEFGLPRPGNNVAESWYLYYDGDLSAVLFKVPTAPAVQPHDHGVWETLLVYRGALRHSVYERTDDGRVAGRAVLRECESTTLHPGDYAVIAPPRDIHGFCAVTDDTYGITISRGLYNPERLYFDVEAETCATRRPRTLR